MKICESLEKREQEILSPFATLSCRSRGREREETPCDLRPCFQRDRDRILYSKSFRRLKDKTQVFLTPDGDHYRTRMTHTLEVSQNARTIARALRLNEDLAEAIAFGHDIGHTPFGHAGERALAAVAPCGFKHNEQSLRIVEVLEKDGEGLNLTWEVRDGILNHQLSLHPSTPEGQIVRFSDKIAYIYHDMDDAIRGGIVEERELPREIARVIGQTNGEWLDTFIHDIIVTSEDSPEIRMSGEVAEAMEKLRAFMFERVYTNPTAKGEEGKATSLVQALYEHYCEHPEELPRLQQKLLADGEALERCVCDHISSMTDRYAIARYDELFIPKSWAVY
ncbi:MAG: deoxyguanosinetriphosphate triphosphohydrolase [Lachnospiraceae bacterium]|nr:deoxyguanosinetriphosphate triphosphohydrolase [Lachnospiraceae bacterium]